MPSDASPRSALAQQKICTQSAPCRFRTETQPSVVAPVVRTSSTNIILEPAKRPCHFGLIAKALTTAFRRLLGLNPRMLGVFLGRNSMSGTNSRLAASASSLPIKADWLNVRDQMRVQCNGTGVIMILLRSSGT